LLSIIITMSNYSFGSGSGSYGQFWFGGSSFPGFLYKRNLGVGGRRSTKMTPGGNITCNSPTYLYNKYKPGAGGVGASSTSNRRAKNRLATVCSGQQCFPCYPTLGQYSNYTGNPNGFIPCPGTINIISNGSVTPRPPSGTYTVTYLGNGNTGGTSPTDSNSPYNSGTSVTILGNSGSLTKSGVAVFAGWNTAADGSETNYVGGDTFNITQNTTLYARWVASGSRLRYNAGTGGSGTAPSSSGTYYTPFSTADIVSNTGSFTNTNGYTFGGWNTAANGSGTSYPPGSKYTMPATGNVDLYAQWINPATPYTLTYLAGTGGSGTSPTGSPTIYSSNSTATISGNTGPFTNSDPTKIFYGWNTAADGTGTSYPAGSTITMNANKTLYAQWVSATPQYTVTYIANGATGTIPVQTYPGGVQVTISGQSSLTRPGYAFLGWNTAANGTGSVYVPTSSVVINSNITLYAQWAPGTVIKDCGSFTGAVTIPSIYLSGGRTVFRDTTTNTITIIIPTFYSNNGAPYGIGNGPIDNIHSGNLNSSYATATISQVLGVYQINTTYTTAYTGGTYTQTSTLSFGSTYWPTGETISTVTIPAPNNPATFNFDPSGTNISVTSGCFGGASYSSGTTTQNSVISFYINFSNGTSTRVAVGTQFRWTGTTNTYTYVFNYTRAELANGTTPSPITGTFTPTSSTGVNTPNV
jgi:uncharacterized repeat protein (TIGR02543 family)